MQAHSRAATAQSQAQNAKKRAAEATQAAVQAAKRAKAATRNAELAAKKVELYTTTARTSTYDTAKGGGTCRTCHIAGGVQALQMSIVDCKDGGKKHLDCLLCHPI